MSIHCYLVTGAAGFIASNVSRLLLDAGHVVVGVDNLNDAYDRRIKEWRLKSLLSTPRFSFVRGDIADAGWLGSVFADIANGNSPRWAADSNSGPGQAKPGDGAKLGNRAPPFDAVFNLAARAGVRASVTDPWVYYQTNVSGTLALLEECRRWGVKKFILASTSSLYGASTVVPFREDSDTSRPLSPYAASKKAAETLAYSFHHLHGLDVSVPRYFTVYGPAGRPDMSVFRFIRRIAEDEPITVYGDGRQERDFTYVDDIARGTVAAVAPCGYEEINLGGDRPVALVEVIRQIGKLLGNQPRIEYRPAHPADVPATWADIGKARKLLGWSPQVSLEEGLRRSVEWYRQHRDEIVPWELEP